MPQKQPVQCSDVKVCDEEQWNAVNKVTNGPKNLAVSTGDRINKGIFKRKCMAVLQGGQNKAAIKMRWPYYWGGCKAGLLKICSLWPPWQATNQPSRSFSAHFLFLLGAESLAHLLACLVYVFVPGEAAVKMDSEQFGAADCLYNLTLDGNLRACLFLASDLFLWLAAYQHTY